MIHFVNMYTAKRFISLILCLAFVFTLSVTAIAEESQKETEGLDITVAGFQDVFSEGSMHESHLVFQETEPVQDVMGPVELLDISYSLPKDDNVFDSLDAGTVPVLGKKLVRYEGPGAPPAISETFTFGLYDLSWNLVATSSITMDEWNVATALPDFILEDGEVIEAGSYYLREIVPDDVGNWEYDTRTVLLYSNGVFFSTNMPSTFENVYKGGEVPSVSIKIDNAALSCISKGSTLQMTATTNPSNATVYWTSSTPTIATIDENGVVTGIKSGMVRITATTSSGQTAAVAVRVTA